MTLEEKSVYSESLPLTRIPHTSRLFADYLTNFEAVARFYPRNPLAHGQWFADEANRIQYSPARRARVADILESQNRRFGCGEKTLANLEKFRRGDSVVVTGQQVGLFGGPLFAILKAITAVKLAAEATQAGVDTVPVFWLATEDHDLEEVNHVSLISRDGTIEKIVSTSQGLHGAPVSDVRFGGEILDVLDQVSRILPDSEAVDCLRQCYRPGVPYGEACACLFTCLFSDFGIILIDPSEKALHEIAAPVFCAALDKSHEIEKALLARGRELRDADYHEQVKVTKNSTLLFTFHNGVRTVIQRLDGRFVYGDQRVTGDELKCHLENAPQDFSANVLLRPVMQDYLLPTLAYVGGPAEVAYFAQAATVYDAISGRVTPVMPRLTATLVEPKIKRILDKYSLTVPDFFHGADVVRATMADRSLPRDLRSSFDSARASVESSIASIREQIAQLDPTLVGATDKAAAKLEYQFERLRRRAAAAEVRKNSEIARHAEIASAWIFPHKEPQERVIGGIQFVAMYGRQLLASLYDAARTDSAEHVILYL